MHARDRTASSSGAQLRQRVATLELCVLVALDPRHCGASKCGFSTMSYKSSVNLAFSNENQALASCLAKALGLATKETSDLLVLTSKGFGRFA
jgi:hypothetical protein